MKMSRLGAAIAVALSLSACATITRGTKEKFYVTSDPDGADVEMSNGLRCHTPCKLKVDRKTDMTVRVIKPGYETAEVHVQGKVKGGGAAGGVLGNALLGGVIGLGVDASTGAMLDLKPNPVTVKLVAIAAAAPEAVPAVAPVPAAPAPVAVAAPAAAPVAAPAAAVAPAIAAPTPAAATGSTPTAGN